MKKMYKFITVLVLIVSMLLTTTAYADTMKVETWINVLDLQDYVAEITGYRPEINIMLGGYQDDKVLIHVAHQQTIELTNLICIENNLYVIEQELPSELYEGEYNYYWNPKNQSSYYGSYDGKYTFSSLDHAFELIQQEDDSYWVKYNNIWLELSVEDYYWSDDALMVSANAFSQVYFYWEQWNKF